MLIDRELLVKSIAIGFNQNNVSIKSYLNKIVKLIQIEHITMKSFKNYSKLFYSSAINLQIF